MIKKVLLLGLVLVLSLMILLNAAVFANPIEVSIYCILSRSAVLTEATFKFAELVEERTNGRVKFDVYHSGELGGDIETLEQMRHGMIDMRITGVALHSHFYPQTQMLELPYLFKNRYHLQDVLYGPIGRGLLDGFEQYGVKGLTIVDIGFRNISNSRRPVRSVEDVRGLKIRVPEIDSYVRVWDKWGASPVAMAWPDVYMSLQTGVLDAQDNAPEHTYSNNTYEVQKYYSVINYIWMGSALTMNLDKWNSIPEDIQNIMMEVAQEVSEWTFDVLEEKNEWALDMMEQAGLEITRDVDVSGFMKLAQETYVNFEKEPWYDADFIDAIRKIGEKY